MSVVKTDASSNVKQTSTAIVVPVNGENMKDGQKTTDIVNGHEPMDAEQTVSEEPAVADSVSDSKEPAATDTGSGTKPKEKEDEKLEEPQEKAKEKDDENLEKAEEHNETTSGKVESATGTTTSQEPVRKEEELDFSKFLNEVSKGYQMCETHRDFYMDKSIVCLRCQELICALCLREGHNGHDFVSVGKLKECKEKRDSMEEDLSRLQLLQQNLSKQIDERKMLKSQTENSLTSLLTKVDAAFLELKSRVEGKHKEIKSHIEKYSKGNTDELDNELSRLNKLEDAARGVIRTVIRSFTRTDLSDDLELPSKLQETVKLVEGLHLPGLETKSLLPEKKFSKILPSLEAVSNICQTIHPEATKVIWQKVTPDKRKQEEAAKRMPKLKRAKTEDHDHPENVESTQPSAYSSRSTSTGASRSSKTSVASTTTVAKAVSKTDTSRSEAKTVVSPSASSTSASPTTSKSRPSRKAPASSSRARSSSESTDDGSVPDSSSTVDPSIRTDALTMEVGRCILIRGHLEMLWIGRVSNISKLQDNKFFNVQWFLGEVGKQKIFSIADRWIKKADTVHADCVICHFEFDSTKPITKTLEKKLIHVADKHKEALDRAKRNPLPPSKLKQQEEKEQEEKEKSKKQLRKGNR